MARGLRISSSVASPVLLLCLAASVLGVAYFRSSSSGLTQAIVVLVSMAIIFFASHPLGHFFWAMAYGVRTEYYFLGRSDFRKLPLRPARLAGGLVPTIGTKLRKEELSKLAPRKRGYVFGAGVIVSNTLVGIELLYVLFLGGFGPLAGLAGGVFFMVMLATEILFSTKVGDLAKMTREFRSSSPQPPL